MFQINQRLIGLQTLSISLPIRSGDLFFPGRPSVSLYVSLSAATATVSVDTIELGVYIASHHFSLFTLSVAAATVSVDTVELDGCIAKNTRSGFNKYILSQDI